MTNLEHSLRRLQNRLYRSLLDPFLDFQTPMEETMRSLDNAVKSGKIRYIGVSDTPAWKRRPKPLPGLKTGRRSLVYKLNTR